MVLAGDAKEEGSAQALGVLSEVLSLPLELHEESYERIPKTLDTRSLASSMSNEGLSGST